MQPANTPLPALFSLTFVPSARIHVLLPCNELARDVMGELFQTTKSVLIDESDAKSNDSIQRISNLTRTAPYGCVGSRFTIVNINIFQPQ